MEGLLSLNNYGILLSLVAIEAILSADNAVALAALVQPISDRKQQRQALNLGLIAAFILRIVLIITATWIMNFWQFQLAGSLYLLWLFTNYLLERFNQKEAAADGQDFPMVNFEISFQFIGLIALTDLAFSLDSVATAVALSNQLWIVLFGAVLGIITLRFLGELFIHWLSEFVYLKDAAYLTIFVIGLRLFIKALFSDYLPPEWLVLSLIAGLLTWGFSQKA